MYLCTYVTGCSRILALNGSNSALIGAASTSFTLVTVYLQMRHLQSEDLKCILNAYFVLPFATLDPSCGKKVSSSVGAVLLVSFDACNQKTQQE